MHDLTHLSLFTGIGGFDLAAAWTGFKTVGQVEQDPYALRVLRRRFGREIPRWTDIRDLSADDFKRRTGIDSPTLISGGFPCQPFSCAGKREGKEDDRYIWPEMLRVVRELRPSWMVGENVAGFANMALESCCSDLEDEGYTVRAFLIPAAGESEPLVGRVAHGVPRRVDRLRCLGNAVVPQQVYPILASIAQIEEEKVV